MQRRGAHIRVCRDACEDPGRGGLLTNSDNEPLIITQRKTRFTKILFSK